MIYIYIYIEKNMLSFLLSLQVYYVFYDVE